MVTTPRRARFQVLVFGLLLAAPVGAAHSASAGPPTANLCDPAPHYRAARDALAEGDRPAAVEHLKRAAAILKRCSRPADASPESGDEGHVTDVACRARENYERPSP